MVVSLIILGALVAVGLPLYLHYRWSERREKTMTMTMNEDESQSQNQGADEVCCGMHVTCEKDSLLASVSQEIEYYDDEELDAYKGRNADEYDDNEIEQFRDVLLTLLPTDIAGWGRSLQLRGITLPSTVRDELLLIVAEARK